MARKFSTKVLDTLLKVVSVELKIPIGVADITFPVSEYAKEWWKSEKAREDLLKAIQTSEEKFIQENPNNKAAQILHDFSIRGEKDFQVIVSNLLNHLSEDKITDLAASKLAFGFETIISKEELQKALNGYLPYLQHELIGLEGFREIISAITIQKIDKTTSQTLEVVKEVDSKLGIFLKTQNSIPHVKLPEFVPEIIANLEELPAPGQLPPGSRIPHHRNAIFTGRTNNLRQLAEILLLFRKVPTTPIAAVTGIGGIGKTQLAVEFCYRYGRYFHGVHWINAQDDNFDAEIAACGRDMSIPDFPEGIPKQVALTLQMWKKEPQRVIILDNIDDIKTLREWLPKLYGIPLLVTTRRQQWSSDLGLEPQPLYSLPREDSVILLQRLAPRLKDALDSDIDLLAKRLGDLPLALDLAGRYLQARGVLTIGDYLIRLDEAGNDLKHTSLAGWAKDSSPTKHETNLTSTFWITWQQLGNNEIDELAKKFFFAAGYLAPNIPIPREFFVFLSLPDDKEKLEKMERAGLEQLEEMIEDALLHLQSFGLLSDTLALHPLLAEFSLLKVVGNSVLTEFVNKVSTQTYMAISTSIPANFAILRPHLEVLVFHAERAGLTAAREIWNNLGVYYFMVAEYEGSINAYNHAVAITEKKYGKENAEVAAMVNNLGSVQMEMGNFKDAKLNLERALTIWEKTDIDQNNMAAVLSNLGAIYKHLGDLSKAKSFLERALAFAIQTGDPQKVATFLNNLGGVLKDMGANSSAKELYERALVILKTLFGEEHPQVATTINNIGVVLHNLNSLTDAKAHYELALTIDEKIFGLEHPNVARDVSNLGLTLKYMGNFNDAKKLYERALTIDKKLYPPMHPHIAIDLTNLGLVLEKTGDLESSKSMLQQALAIRKEAYGNHPIVVESLHNLAILLIKLNEFTQAFVLEQQSLAILRNYYPPEHPEIQLTFSLLQQINGNIKDGNVEVNKKKKSKQRKRHK